jgi:hypothetical protein
MRSAADGHKQAVNDERLGHKSAASRARIT